MSECFGVSVFQRGGRVSLELYKYKTVMDTGHETKSAKTLEDSRNNILSNEEKDLQWPTTRV